MPSEEPEIRARISHKERAAKRKEIADFIAAGGTITDASTRFRTSTSSIYGACKEHGVTIPSTLSHKERATKRKEIANFISAGGTLLEAAKEFGRTATSIYTACEENGVTIPREPAGRMSVSTYKIIAELREGGTDVATIAKKHGISRQRVHQIREQAKNAGLLE